MLVKFLLVEATGEISEIYCEKYIYSHTHTHTQSQSQGDPLSIMLTSSTPSSAHMTTSPMMTSSSVLTSSSVVNSGAGPSNVEGGTTAAGSSGTTVVGYDQGGTALTAPAGN